MTEAAKRTTARTRTGDSQPTLNGHGPHGDHDLVRDNDDNTTRDRRTERDSRDEQRTEGDEQDRRRGQGLTAMIRDGATRGASRDTETAPSTVTVGSPVACSAPWSS